MRYLVTILGVICLLACSSEETTRTAETTSQMRPIAFGDAYTVKPTRSSEAFTATKGIPVGQSMGVYAYLHNTETRNYSADIPNFMFNQQATSQDDTEPFSYEPLKYWPNDENSKVSFIAYFPYTNTTVVEADPEHPVSPFSTATTGLTPLLENDDTGLPTFNFTVKDNVDDQVDFLVSEVVPNLPKTRDTEGDPHQPFNDLTIYDRVPFLFKHMTAKVEFRIVADAAIHKDIVSFHLDTLNVSHLYKNGTLTPEYKPATGETKCTWSDHNLKHAPTSEYKLKFKTYEPQLLMPQELGNDVMLRVSYEIKFKSDGTTYHYEGGEPVADQEYKYKKTDEVKLNTMKKTGTDEALTKWEPNHHYIYTIRLRANRIDFTGQVVDWGEYVKEDMNEIEIKDE